LREWLRPDAGIGTVRVMDREPPQAFRARCRKDHLTRSVPMRSTVHARFVAALLLLAGCQGYVRSSAPVAPGAEMVRIPFVRPQAIVIARDDPAQGWSDTIDAVTSVQGRILEVNGDTLRLAVDMFGRNGAYYPVAPGRHAIIAMSTARRVERRGFSVRNTVVQGTAGTVGIVLVAGLLTFLLLVLTYEDES
jgi:hypothetical protein